MAGRKTLVQLEYNSNVESLLKEVDKLMNGSHQPDLIYIKFSSAWFPRRELDMPDELNRLFHVNPKVKACWDGFPDEYTLNEEDGTSEYRNVDELPDFNTRKVVVTLTSWHQRIGNCKTVIESLLGNTLVPDLIFLNLSV